MAEDKDDYGEEYQYSELDAISPEVDEENVTKTTVKKNDMPNIRRNAVVAIVVIILLMLAYKYLSPLFNKKPQSDLTTIPAVKSPVPPPIEKAVIKPSPEETTTKIEEPPPTVKVQPSPSHAEFSELTQKVTSLESEQQNLRVQIEALNNQLTTMSASVAQMVSQVSTLNQNFTNLLVRMEDQEKKLSIITLRSKPRLVRKHLVITAPPPTYYIQAVIPGRAWLIAQNGSTITVREGTPVAGYGVVKLIDSKQGKIITSSGRVIRFSQQDS